MSNLIPVKRTDKNGVVTTKHVRADPTVKKPAKLTSSLIPAPVADQNWNIGIDNPARKQTQATVNSIFVGLGHKLNNVPFYMIRNVENMSHGEVRAICDAVMKTDDAEPVAMRRIRIYSLISQYREGHSDFRAVLSADKVLRGNSSLEFETTTDFIEKLSEYDEMREAVSDLSAADSVTQRHVCDIGTAITNLAGVEISKKTSIGEYMYFMNVRCGRMFINDKAILDALVKYPDRTQDIVKMVVERGNVNAIEEVMGNTTAISEGAL